MVGSRDLVRVFFVSCKERHVHEDSFECSVGARARDRIAISRMAITEGMKCCRVDRALFVSVKFLVYLAPTLAFMSGHVCSVHQ